MDANELSDFIQFGVYTKCGVPSSIRFDRIDVSDIMDEEYLGIARVCKDWGGMLKDTEHATLVGHFMEWVEHCEDGYPSIEHSQELLGELVDQKRVCGVMLLLAYLH